MNLYGRTCVRVGNGVSEWFQVNVGLRQGPVMSPWMFNVYKDGVVREVNIRVLWKGLELLSANGGRFEISHLFFADDTALVADSEAKLCRLMSPFGRVCERRKLKVYVGKSNGGKIMGANACDTKRRTVRGSGLF